jgi:type II secretory pathway pseudopilin PulG
MDDELKSTTTQSSSAEPWWKQKLVLLIAGFLLTGLVGPWLQFVQKSLELKREISLQAYNRRIAAMQHAREELTKIYVGGSFAIEQFEYERTHRKSSATRTASTTSSSRFDISRQDRLRETAKLYVVADIFPDPGRIKGPLEKTLVAWKVLDDAVHDIEMGFVQVDDKKVLELYQRAKQQFDENYELARHAIETEIGGFEDAHQDRPFLHGLSGVMLSRSSSPVANRSPGGNREEKK